MASPKSSGFHTGFYDIAIFEDPGSIYSRIKLSTRIWVFEVSSFLFPKHKYFSNIKQSNVCDVVVCAVGRFHRVIFK